MLQETFFLTQLIDMTKEEKGLLKVKIHETIATLENEIIHLEEVAAPVSPENSIGRVSRMDAINNKSVAEASLRSAKRKLANLKHALTKMDLPNFGDCARCKQPIPSARLMYMPDSPYCVRCADR